MAKRIMLDNPADKVPVIEDTQDTIVLNPPVRAPFVGNTQEFADFIGVEYLQASGLLRCLKDMGIVKVVDKRAAKGGGRGKPSDIYEVPLTLTLDFGAVNAKKAA